VHALADTRGLPAVLHDGHDRLILLFHDADLHKLRSGTERS
jgi:hypothetical protein